MSLSLNNLLELAVIEFRSDEIDDLVSTALAAGMTPNQIMLEGLVPGLDEVGRLYSNGIYFLPELVMCGDVVKQAMDILDPLFAKGTGATRPGRVVIGTVEGDIHDIGKNMVIIMLKGSGYEIIDLGVNVDTSMFVDAMQEYNPDILALSALLLTTRIKMGKVIDALIEADIRDQVKVMVGGCAVDLAFATQIGADGYGADAVEAVRVAKRMMALAA